MKAIVINTLFNICRGMVFDKPAAVFKSIISWLLNSIAAAIAAMSSRNSSIPKYLSYAAENRCRNLFPELSMPVLRSMSPWSQESMTARSRSRSEA